MKEIMSHANTIRKVHVPDHIHKERKRKHKASCMLLYKATILISRRVISEYTKADILHCDYCLFFLFFSTYKPVFILRALSHCNHSKCNTKHPLFQTWYQSQYRLTPISIHFFPSIVSMASASSLVVSASPFVVPNITSLVTTKLEGPNYMSWTT